MYIQPVVVFGPIICICDLMVKLDGRVMELLYICYGDFIVLYFVCVQVFQVSTFSCCVCFYCNYCLLCKRLMRLTWLNKG